jgi:hypothetical protein
MLDKLLFSKTAKTSKDKAEQASPRHIEVHRRPSSDIASKAFASSPRMSDSEQQGQVSTASVALPKRQQRVLVWSLTADSLDVRADKVKQLHICCCLSSVPCCCSSIVPVLRHG